MTATSNITGARLSGWLASAVLAALASACGTQTVQAQHSCPAGQVPRIVDLMQGVQGIPTAKINAICPNWIRRGDDGLIEDFEDDNSQTAKLDGRNGYWWMHSDPNGSTILPGSFMPEQNGASGTDRAIHIWGQTASSQAAYGSQLGLDFIDGGKLYDASKYIGIRFKARIKEGTSKTVRFNIPDVNTHKNAGVCTDCWNHFGRDISLATEWQEYAVLFDEVRQAPGWGSPRPSNVTSGQLWGINWAIGVGRNFDVWVDDVEFIQCQ